MGSLATCLQACSKQQGTSHEARVQACKDVLIPCAALHCQVACLSQHVSHINCDFALLYRAQRLAFTGWRQGILVQREHGNKLQRAVGFFAQSTLAAAWNGWRAALAHKRENQDKVAASVARLLQRDLAQSWQSWREAVAWRQMKLQASCPVSGEAVFRRPSKMSHGPQDCCLSIQAWLAVHAWWELWSHEVAGKLSHGSHW